MRLDVYLVTNGYTESRESAKRLIEAGEVTVDGVTVTRPSTPVLGAPSVSLNEPRFVSRGGEKMEAALRLFGIDPTGLSVLDVGASTGGFTDCLLQWGAASSVTVDAGTGQLHPKLLRDPRVRNVEKYNARELSASDVGVFPLAVMDVSFISQTYILPNIPACLTEGGRLVSLIKPQFEAGRAALGKKGIVRAERDRALAIRRVLDMAVAVGLCPVGLAPSPILGGDGNEEFLALFVKGEGRGPLTDSMIENTVKKKAVILL